MDAFIGTVMLVANNYAPLGWVDCNGQLLNINAYQALYSLLGTTYGGDGRTTFGVPNLQGRVPVGIGQGAGLNNYVLGATGGTETVTLTANQMPAHTHNATQANSTVSGGTVSGATVTIKAASNAGDHNSPAANDALGAFSYNGDAVNAYVSGVTPTVALQGGSISGGSISGATVTNGAITNAPTGGNQAHSNMQPYIALRYIICTEGIYPQHP